MKYLLSIIFFTASSLTHSGEWTDSGTIVGLFVDNRPSSSRILVSHSAAFTNPNGECRKDKNLYQLKTDTEYSDAALSLILSAEARSANIRFYLDGCGTDWPLIVITDTTFH